MRLHRTALALCLALGPATALAQQQQPPPPAAIAEARERYQRGIDLFEERNYDAAMAEFQRAYELTRNPAVLFNISAPARPARGCARSRTPPCARRP